MKIYGECVNLTTSVFSALVFSTIDYFSIGGALFSISDLPAENTIFFSSFIYVLTAFTSQLIYGLTSSISTGFIATIIFEAVVVSREIATVCYRQIKNSDGEIHLPNFYMNVYFCMGISTLIFSVLSLIPSIYKVGDLLRDIPLVAIYATMTFIGSSLFMESINKYIAEFTHLNMALLSITLLSALIIFAVEKKYPKFTFLIPTAAITVVIGFNIVAKTIFKLSLEDLKELKLILDLKSTGGFSIKEFFALFKNSKIIPSCVIANFNNIFSLALFNLIHINVNLPPYGFVTGNSIDINSEWRAQSITNMFNIFTGFPSYFVGTSSIFFYKAGGNSRISTILASFVPLIIGKFSCYLVNYIPNILSSIILCYVGLVFLQGYLYNLLVMASRIDIIIGIVSIIICNLIGIVAGFTAAIAMASICIIKFYLHELRNKNSKSTLSTEIVNNEHLVKIDYILCFMTLSKFKQDLGYVKNEMTLDLSNCMFMDMNANMFLYEYIKKLNRVRIIGKPANFYEHLFKSRQNIHLTEKMY